MTTRQLKRPDAPAARGRSGHRDPIAHARQGLRARGEPMVWLAGGGLALALLMIGALLSLVVVQGSLALWPWQVLDITLKDGKRVFGEVSRSENAVDATGHAVARRLIRTGNFDITGEHFRWIDDQDVTNEAQPPWALVLERRAWGRFYGFPRRFEAPGEATVTAPDAVWSAFERHHAACLERYERKRSLETDAIGGANHRLETARLRVRSAELARGATSTAAERARADAEAVRVEVESEIRHLRDDVAAIDAENAKFRLVMATVDGREAVLAPGDIVRASAPNQLGVLGRIGVLLSRWREFLFDDPREANSEGGIFPAIVGTAVMTIMMSLLVVPFGVLAALWLREYAKPGFIVTAVRIAVNNLAGVPSIVFGVFGVGFFCYTVGAAIDREWFTARLPAPTFGTGGVLWSALTLALLTLPVVIVATEEALSAVPRSMREGSYACGASRWQTIRRIVLPRAMPGIITGFILAMARGAGEVAPLMMVGAVKVAPELPIDSHFPFIHLDRSFMHLGFHVYDLGFQSQNSEAAKPMVYATTLVLIGFITLLNLMAMRLRARLRARFLGGQF